MIRQLICIFISVPKVPLCKTKWNYWFALLCSASGFQRDQEQEGRSLAVSQMHPVPLKNLKWSAHAATYLPKRSWRLINTCDPFPRRTLEWDFKSCAKPHVSCCVGMERRGRRGSEFSSKLKWLSSFPAYASRQNPTSAVWNSVFSYCDGIPHNHTTLLSFTHCFPPSLIFEDLNRSLAIARRCSWISMRHHLWDEAIDRFRGGCSVLPCTPLAKVNSTGKSSLSGRGSALRWWKELIGLMLLACTNQLQVTRSDLERYWTSWNTMRGFELRILV